MTLDGLQLGYINSSFTSLESVYLQACTLHYWSYGTQIHEFCSIHGLANSQERGFSLRCTLWAWPRIRTSTATPLATPPFAAPDMKAPNPLGTDVDRGGRYSLLLALDRSGEVRLALWTSICNFTSLDD